MDFTVLINLFLAFFVLIAGIIVFKQEVFANEKGPNSLKEKDIEIQVKNSSNHFDLISMLAISVICQFISKRQGFEFSFFYQAVLISTGIQAAFFLFKAESLKSMFFYKICCVVIFSFLL